MVKTRNEMEKGSIIKANETIPSITRIIPMTLIINNTGSVENKGITPKKASKIVTGIAKIIREDLTA